MNWLEWTAVIVGGSTVYVYVAFLALCTAKRMQAAAKLRGLKLPWDLRVVCYALLVGGWPADVVYNWTVGNWRFRFQTPWKLTYSSRIQWHVDNLAESANPQKAILWGVLLDAGDPGHTKRLPPVAD